MKTAFVICMFVLAATTVGADDFSSLVQQGSPSDVQEAIDAGAQLEAMTGRFRKTPLMRAAQYNENPQVIEVLIEAGADVNARNQFGGTPLMRAAGVLIGNENAEVIELLIEAGADVNARDQSGRTPLMRAALYSEKPEIIELLIEAGASMHVRDQDGWTALMIAARHNEKSEVIERMIDAGAQITDTVWELIQYNEHLKGTDVYWRINEMRFE